MRKSLVSLCCLFAFCVASTAHAFDLNELSVLLHRDEASTVHYVEHQYRKVLTSVIEQRGELTFTPPDRFEKHVLEPQSERYVLTGNTLSIELPGRKTRQLSTRNQPLLRGLLLSFQAVVAGQLDNLKPEYDIALQGDANAWQLNLKPLNKDLAHYIKSIVVTGVRNQPRQFEITETSGDRTVTDITP